jgi:hypothetical protein
MQVLRSHCSTELALSTSLEEKAYLRIACIARVLRVVENRFFLKCGDFGRVELFLLNLK